MIGQKIQTGVKLPLGRASWVSGQNFDFYGLKCPGASYLPKGIRNLKLDLRPNHELDFESSRLLDFWQFYWSWIVKLGFLFGIALWIILILERTCIWKWSKNTGIWFELDSNYIEYNRELYLNATECKWMFDFLNSENSGLRDFATRSKYIEVS